MLPADDTISGLIEFEPYEARLALRSSAGNDETVHATLLSLAQDLLFNLENEPSEWTSESIACADVERLSEDLLLVYRRIERRRTSA
jgi:hypothetical protein